jgi:hypothetical protein
MDATLNTMTRCHVVKNVNQWSPVPCLESGMSLIKFILAGNAFGISGFPGIFPS